MQLVKQLEEAGVFHVAVLGEVSQKNLNSEQDPLADLLGPDCYQARVLLNLHGVEVLDSSGVGWLLACHRRFRTGGGTLVLHSLSPFARDVLKVLNMHLLFKMAEDERSARKFVQGQTP